MTMKPTLAFLFIVLFLRPFNIFSQTENDQNVILITLDGLRWQELFTGADPKLIADKKYVDDTISLKKDFWRASGQERRSALLPFIWNEAISVGEIHGNRNLASRVNLTNTQLFSYPGYNEILTGKADDIHITSNDKIYNPNRSVLEEINAYKKFKGKVAAFGSWDVFPYILNDIRSGIPVNAGFEAAEGAGLSDREIFLNKLQKEVPSPWASVRLDAFTHNYALEYMKRKHPRLIYIAYGETDDFAHDGKYDAYLKAARTTDAMIKELWEYVEQDAFYKGKTTFIITTDHGRGTQPLDTWRSHGADIVGADEVWLIVLGARAKQLGEFSSEEQLYATQIEALIKSILN